MNSELKSMEQNKACDFVEFPEGCKQIGCKLVSRQSPDSNDNVEWHKARLVAKSYVKKMHWL